MVPGSRDELGRWQDPSSFVATEHLGPTGQPEAGDHSNCHRADHGLDRIAGRLDQVDSTYLDAPKNFYLRFCTDSSMSDPSASATRSF
jgi:hypothetical protein